MSKQQIFQMWKKLLKGNWWSLKVDILCDKARSSFLGVSMLAPVYDSHDFQVQLNKVP